jgi:hypothetical protein
MRVDERLGKITLPVQTNIICLDLTAAGISIDKWVGGGGKKGHNSQEREDCNPLP